jgi:hypothetical protein
MSGNLPHRLRSCGLMFMRYFWFEVDGPDAAASGEGVASEFDTRGFEMRQPCRESRLAFFGQIQGSDRLKFGADDFCSRLHAATKSFQFGVCVIGHAAPSNLRRSAGIWSGSRLSATSAASP